MKRLTAKERALLIDELIGFINLTEGKTVTNGILSKKFNLDYNLVHTITQELIAKGYLKSGPTLSGRSGEPDLYVLPTPSGKYFYSFEGGASEEYRKNYWKKLLAYLSASGTVIMGIATIFVSYWGVEVQRNSTISYNELTKRDSTISALKKENESIKASLVRLRKDSAATPPPTQLPI